MAFRGPRPGQAAASYRSGVSVGVALVRVCFLKNAGLVTRLEPSVAGPVRPAMCFIPFP
jgi:hypothetical protein